MQYFDSLRDPVDNSIADTYFFRSTSSTYTSSTIVFPDLIIPASPNFPASTATRYMINLPGEPYYVGIEAGNSTFVIKNVSTTTILTRVAYTATLTANTYKIFPPTAGTPGRIEVHVGVGSGTGGDILSYAGRFINSILGSSCINSFNLGQMNKISTNSFLDPCIVCGDNNNINVIDGNSIVIGSSNTLKINNSIIVGFGNLLDSGIAGVEASGAFGSSNYVYGKESFAMGNENIIVGDYNLVSGSSNASSGAGNLINGINNILSGSYNMIGGSSNIITGDYNLISGKNNSGNINYSIVGGSSNSAGDYVIAGGSSNIVTDYGICGGANNIIQGTHCLCGGYENTITGGGDYSFVVGTSNAISAANCSAIGLGIDIDADCDYSNAFGLYTTVGTTGAIVFGKYGGTTLAWAIHLAGGSDTSNKDISVIIRTTVFGNPAGGGGIGNNWSSTGADYAEYFEWEDENKKNEDRIGFFVEHAKEETIKIANGKENILGVVSNGSGFIGDAALRRWSKVAKTDKFGRWITKKVINQFGAEEIQSIPSTDWDKSREYISRADRQEWSIIGLLGKLYVRDNGNCEPGKYCRCSNDGIAEPSNSTAEQRWRVMSRSATDVIKIFFK